MPIVNAISDPVQKAVAAKTQDLEGKARKVGLLRSNLPWQRDRWGRRIGPSKKLDPTLLPAELAALRETIRILDALETARLALRPPKVARRKCAQIGSSVPQYAG